MATSDLEIEGQGHKTIAFVALPIYTHIPNLKVLTKIFFKLSRPKGNLCSGGGVTVLNPKYPRLSSGDTNILNLFIWGFTSLEHCTGHIMTGSWEGRGNQYIQLVKVLYCKLPTNGKQLPAFPLEVGPGTEPRSQRWEARVLPLGHHGP